MKIITNTKKWKVVCFSILVNGCLPTCMCMHERRGKLQENPICMFFSYFESISTNDGLWKLKRFFYIFIFMHNTKTLEWFIWVGNGYDFVCHCDKQNEWERFEVLPSSFPCPLMKWLQLTIVIGWGCMQSLFCSPLKDNSKCYYNKSNPKCCCVLSWILTICMLKWWAKSWCHLGQMESLSLLMLGMCKNYM